MMISRVNEIEELLNDSPAIALIGPRQCGKSTLARQIFNQSGNKALYLDLELPEDLNALADPVMFFKHNQDKLIIIDEIQIKPELFSILRPVIDMKRTSGRFLLLGSASPSLVKGVSESLAGRITYVELAPFHLKEVLPHQYSYKELWFRGGFPRSLLAKSETASLRWRKDFTRSYIERDLALLFHTELSPAITSNFWQMLSHAQGGVWNAQTFARSLGVSAPTVLRYLSFLEGAFLLRSLQPWFVNAKKRLVKSPKIYVRDSGIVHSMMNIENMNQLLGHPVAGGSWEGFVIEQIIQQLPSEIRPFYYRTHQGAEADLILVNGLKPVACIEIKLNNAPSTSRGFGEVISDLETNHNFIVTPESKTYGLKNNLKVCGLVDFLENELLKVF